jgi:hypothetical protein
MNYLEEKPRVDPIDRVKNMVRHSLVASPTVTNKELFERAREIAPAVVEGMSLKQFHAKFRLPVTRFEMGTRPRRERKPRSASTTNGASSSDTANANGGPKATKTKRTRSRSRNAVQAATNGAARALIRAAIIEFAVELERAEQRSDLIQVVSRVDGVVDRILKITADPTPTTASTEAAASAEAAA